MKVKLFLLKEIFNFKNIVLLVLFVNFNIFFWQLLQNQAESTLGSLELTLIFVASVSGTSLYHKYSSDYFIKISKLNNKSEFNLKIWIFIFLFLLMIITAVLFIAFVRLYSYLGIYAKNSWLINTGNSRWIKWEYFDKNNWIALTYCVILESLVMLAYVYFINHFSNDKKWMYGILILVLIYSYMFGDFFNVKMGYTAIDGEVLLTIKSEYVGFWTNLGLLITPWEQIGMVMNRLFFETSDSTKGFITEWFNYSQMGAYSILIWTPYLTLLLLISLPNIFKAQI